MRLLDEPAEIMRSFKRAVTDSGREIIFSDDPEKAGVNNLLGIYKAITGKPEAAVLADFAHARGYGDLKKGVAEVVIDMLAPIRQRYDQLMQDPAELDSLLAVGAGQAAASGQGATPDFGQLLINEMAALRREMRELRDRGYMRIVSLAPEVL